MEHGQVRQLQIIVNNIYMIYINTLIDKKGCNIANVIVKGKCSKISYHNSTGNTCLSFYLVINFGIVSVKMGGRDTHGSWQIIK